MEDLIKIEQQKEENAERFFTFEDIDQTTYLNRFNLVSEKDFFSIHPGWSIYTDDKNNEYISPFSINEEDAQILPQFVEHLIHKIIKHGTLCQVLEEGDYIQFGGRDQKTLYKVEFISSPHTHDSTPNNNLIFPESYITIHTPKGKWDISQNYANEFITAVWKINKNQQTNEFSLKRVYVKDGYEEDI